MTKREYVQYQAAVAQFLVDNDAKPGCHGPREENQEPYFSCTRCDCCGSSLGGNRESYTFATDDAPVQAEICTDCVYYLTYGKLDDQTMLEIEGSQA